MNVGGCLLEGTCGSRWCQEESGDRWYGTGEQLRTGGINWEQPCCKLREWSNTGLLLLLPRVETVHRGAGGQGWSGALTSGPSCSLDKHVRYRSAGLGPQRNFKCQILISSSNIIVKRPFTNHSWGPKFRTRLLRVSTTTCPDAYWPFVGSQEIQGFSCTELSQSEPGQQWTMTNTEVLKKHSMHWHRFLGECRTLTVNLYQYFSAI